MTSDPRYRRPELDRSEPIRSWSGVFGGAAPRENGSAPASSPFEPNSVTRAVDIGYRVIDEYLRLGRAQAASSAPAAPPAARDPQRFAEELARSTLDWVATWFDYMQAAAGAGTFARPDHGRGGRPQAGPVGAFDLEGSGMRPPPDPQPSAAGFDVRPPAAASANDGPAEPALVSVDLSSTQRTEVTVELKPGSAGLQLAAYDLRAADPQLPRIGGVIVTAHAADNRVSFRIEVPAGQPPAVYSGLVIDEQTHLPRGTITLRVHAADGHA